MSAAEVTTERGAELGTWLEGLLVASDQAVDPAQVAAAWDVPRDEVEDALLGIAARYERAGAGMRLRRSATGWLLHVAPEVAERVRAVVTREVTARLSAAALETLAVVAYQQPVSRSRVAAIRGVNVDAVMRSLTARGLVEVADHDPTTGAALYTTTPAFLDAAGLLDLSELPEIAPYLPDVESVDLLDSGGST